MCKRNFIFFKHHNNFVSIVYFIIILYIFYYRIEANDNITAILEYLADGYDNRVRPADGGTYFVCICCLLSLL